MKGAPKKSGPVVRGATALAVMLLHLACKTAPTEAPAETATAEVPPGPPPSNGAPASSTPPSDTATQGADMQPNSASPCQKGGCSGELCTDSKGGQPSFSPCVYKPEFACYKSARCERGADGQCAWVNTPELGACLQNPPR